MDRELFKGSIVLHALTGKWNRLMFIDFLVNGALSSGMYFISMQGIKDNSTIVNGINGFPHQGMKANSTFHNEIYPRLVNRNTINT